MLACDLDYFEYLVLTDFGEPTWDAKDNLLASVLDVLYKLLFVKFEIVNITSVYNYNFIYWFPNKLKMDNL